MATNTNAVTVSSYTTALIDRFKDVKGIGSDYAAAKILDVSQQTLSNYRYGVSHADDRICILVAQALGLDPLDTIARVNLERARTDKERRFWKSVVNAAACILVSFCALASSDTYSGYTQTTEYSGGVYIMSN